MSVEVIMFPIKSRVLKHTGDYQIEGVVVGHATMENGKIRYVVEHRVTALDADEVRRIARDVAKGGTAGTPDMLGELVRAICAAVQEGGSFLHIYAAANLRLLALAPDPSKAPTAEHIRKAASRYLAAVDARDPLCRNVEERVAQANAIVSARTALREAVAQ